MENFNKQNTIQFWKLKTFNEKLNASIGFLRIHWKPLLKANAVIAGPLFVLGVGLILFYFQVFVQRVAYNPAQFAGNVSIIWSLFFYVFLAGLLYLIALIGIVLVTFEYVKLAQENSPDIYNTTIIFKNCRKRFWKLVGAGVLCILALFGLSIVVSILSIPLAFIPIIGLFLIIFIRIAVNFIYYSMLYIYIPMSYYEKQDLGKLFGKSREYLQKDFWSTTGMYIGNKAIQYVLANGLLIPFILGIFWYFYLKIENGNFSSGQDFLTKDRSVFIITMLVVFLYFLVNTTFNIFHILSSAVQYFSLKEKNDGDHNFQQIEQFEQLGNEASI